MWRSFPVEKYRLHLEGRVTNPLGFGPYIHLYLVYPDRLLAEYINSSPLDLKYNLTLIKYIYIGSIK